MYVSINQTYFEYALQDFRGALARLLTCTNDQNAFYRPSLTSQYQHRINNHYNNVRNQNEQRYIDSPVWRREQIEAAGATRTVAGNKVESGREKWNDEVRTLAIEQRQKSDYKKNYNEETIELQASALYRIAGAATKNGARKNHKNEIV